MKPAPDLIRGPGSPSHSALRSMRVTRPTCDIKSVEIQAHARQPAESQGGRPGMVFEEATPTTPKPAEPHGTQEMRRT
jgi:hypothetical protein